MWYPRRRVCRGVDGGFHTPGVCQVPHHVSAGQVLYRPPLLCATPLLRFINTTLATVVNEGDGLEGLQLLPDVAHLTELLGATYRDSSFRRQAATKGPEWVEAYFTWQHVVDRLLVWVRQHRNGQAVDNGGPLGGLVEDHMDRYHLAVPSRHHISCRNCVVCVWLAGMLHRPLQLAIPRGMLRQTSRLSVVMWRPPLGCGTHIVHSSRPSHTHRLALCQTHDWQRACCVPPRL